MSPSEIAVSAEASVDREVLERQIQELREVRNRYHRPFVRSAAVALAALFGGFMTAGLSEWLAGCFFVSAVVLFGVATALTAMERGVHPAWGLLSLFGLIFVVMLPDHNSERLDDCRRQLEGKPPLQVEHRSLDQAYLLPFLAIVVTLTIGTPYGLFGFIFSVWGLTKAVGALTWAMRNHRPRDYPIVAVIWATLMNVANVAILAAMLIEDHQPAPSIPQPTIISSGKFVGQFPPGWTKVPAAKPEDHPFLIVNESAGLSLAAFTVAKSDDRPRSLDEFATATLNEEKKRLGTGTHWYGRKERQVGDQRRLYYTFDREARGEDSETCYYAFWESDREYFFVMCFGRTRAVDSRKLDLLLIMDSVKPSGI